MKIKIYGENNDSEKLLKIVQNSLDELGLTDFIELGRTTDKDLVKELNISKEPALIIEESSIEFKDIIFEGMIPKEDEIKSMLISIIGGEAGDSCAPSDCGTCGSASVCGI